MKKILIILSIMFCSVAFAHTIEWYVGDTLLSTTTCESGDNITPPTAPEKYGYHFVKWRDWRPIEYLESTGTQYIDTGVVRNIFHKYKILTRISYSEVVTRQLNGIGGYTYFGVIDGFYQISRQGSSHQNIIATQNKFADFDITFNCPGHEVVFSINNGTLYRETNIYYLNNPVDANFYLFALSGAGPDLMSKQKLSYLKLYDNDILVRDFIPVLDKNGTPCMYDKVEKKFYYNAGTGDFIAGPIVGSGE